MNRNKVGWFALLDITPYDINSNLDTGAERQNKNTRYIYLLDAWFMTLVIAVDWDVVFKIILYFFLTLPTKNQFYVY